MTLPHCPTCACGARKAHFPPLDRGLGTKLAAVGDLDYRIEQLRGSILQLQRERNALLPVNHLPPEIMSLIYVIHRENSTSSTQAGTKINWIAITHVCHSWRSIALEHPSLWNTIDLRAPSLAVEIVNRSRGAPLHVQLSGMTAQDMPSEKSREDLRKMLLLLSKETCRIDALDVTAGSHIELRRILDVVTHSSDRMRYIRLSLDNGDPYAHMPSIKLDCTGLVTSLQRLHLSDCIVHWPSVLFSEGITELNVRFSKRAPDSIGSLQELHEMLARLPRLEHLSMSRCTNGISGRSNAARPIALPRLQMLHLEDTMEGNFSFLRGLVFPETCNTQINSVASSGWTDESISLPRLILRPDRAAPPTLVRVHLDPLQGVLEVHTTSCASAHRLTFTHLSSVHMFLIALAHHIIPRTPDTLVLEPNSRLVPEHWRSIMNGATAHTVQLNCSSPYCGFWDSLVNVPAPAFLPHTRVLVLEDLHFNMLEPSGRQLENEFLLALKQRAKEGSLRRVCLVKCSGVTSDVLKRWQSAFPGIEWDGEDTMQSACYQGYPTESTYMTESWRSEPVYYPGLAF